VELRWQGGWNCVRQGRAELRWQGGWNCVRQGRAELRRRGWAELRRQGGLPYTHKMSDPLIQYLAQRSETGGVLSPVDLERVTTDLFGDQQLGLPRPYKIFFVDENLPPILGFPVRDSAVLRELDSKLSHWINLEAAWQLTRDSSKKSVDQALASYLQSLMRVAENAMLSNLLADYHAIFWLVHSLQLSRHFTNMKKTLLQMDTQGGKMRVDQIRYRVFSRWSVDVKEQMTQLAARIGIMLEGEEERGLQFFRMLQENVLILTEEFISPDLRELRSYLTGYLNHNYFSFRDKFERMRTITGTLLHNDRVFRGAVELFAGKRVDEISTGLLLDARFQRFIFGHPALDRELTPEDRELVQSLSRRIGQFAVLHLLRRGIAWMTSDGAGEIVSTDRRQEVRYARTTRPIDFGHSGVVDPMVNRFGLMYDITNFSETLGNIARGGSKGELGSYRQMLLFQRRLDAISARHRLQLEKFLGDGAFYTTRRVIPLLRAAVEIQKVYDELRGRGFAFDKGLRIALNFGYYRLLPMRFNPGSNERVMEFYGPGVVELSRLTTGKASKEIEEIESFLISHGYELQKVQQFFAPLRETTVTDRGQQQRTYHAYIDANGHLVNEGIVASLPLVEELSDELHAESHQLQLIHAPTGTYIGFRPEMDGIAAIGLSLIGTVSLKGLDRIEIAEVVACRPGEAEITPLDESGDLLKLLRREFHNRFPSDEHPPVSSIPDRERSSSRQRGSKRSRPEPATIIELVLCPKSETSDDGIIIGEWNPYTDEIEHSIRVPRADVTGLLGITGAITKEKLEENKKLLQQIYRKMRESSDLPTIKLDSFRRQREYVGFLLGERTRQNEVQET
jgi:hypothetical protein